MFKGVKGLKKFLSLVVVLILLVGTSVYAQDEPETYKIGAILPLTGRTAYLGVGERESIALAVEQINAKGGINGRKLEVICGDSKGQAKEAVTLANKMIKIDDIKILITSFTPISMSVLPIIDRNKTILFTQCTYPDITNLSDFAFRTYISAEQEVRLLESHVSNHDYRRVAVLYINNTYGNAVYKLFKASFEKARGRVVMGQAYDLSEKDFRSHLIKLKKANPCAIIFMGYGVVYPALMKQLKEMAIDIPVIGNMGFATPAISQAGYEAFEGVVFSTPTFFVSQEIPAAKTFLGNYKKKYGKSPNFDGAYFYDTISIIAEAIRVVGYNPSKLKDQLKTISAFQGVSGKISILPNGDSITDVILATFKGGKVIKINEWLP